MVLAHINDTALFRGDISIQPLSPLLELYPPPPAVSAGDLTAQTLPGAWKDGQASLQEIADALTQYLKFDHPLPWKLLGWTGSR